MYEKYCVLQAFSKSQSIFVKSHGFSSKIVISRVWGREGTDRHTHRRTDARINSLRGGWEGREGGWACACVCCVFCVVVCFVCVLCVLKLYCCVMLCCFVLLCVVCVL